MGYTRKVREGEPSARAKASLCVRIRCKGLDCKVNKTRFRCPARKPLRKYLAKCYEKLLRGESPSSVAIKEKNAEVRAMVVKLNDYNYLKPVPGRFHSFSDDEKKKELKRLLDESEDDVADKLGLDLDYMNDGRAAIHIADGIWLPQYGGAARNRLDHPEGRPPTGPHRLHPNELAQLEKLLDADTNELSEALDDDSNTLDRNRLKEIHAQLEGYITSDDLSLSSKAETEGCILGASKFDDDVEGHTSKLMPQKRAISEALQVLPLRTGVSRTKLADIHPLHNNMIGYIQNESLVSTLDEKQFWTTGVYTPFTEVSSSYMEWSTYDRSDSDSYASTADCYGPHTFTNTG